MKILISDKLADEGVDVLKKVAAFQVDCKFGIRPEELKAIIADYDALIIRSGTKVTADIIESGSRLKFIGRAGVGVDNVDLKVATRRGIVVMNTPGGNTTSTAEHAMSLILSLSRNIPQAHMSIKSGKWDRARFSGVELHGKLLGIVGLGRVGSAVAKMAKAFGMKTIAYDPYISLEIASEMEVEMVELKDLFARSDFITIHTPKNSETKNLISDKEFATMKTSVRVINCARGGIIDEGALVRALENNVIAGCALDVYESEPVAPDHPLLKFDNCVLTPHLGASTSEAQVNVAIEIAETVRDALLGKGIVNAANFPSVDGEAYKVLAPYIDLAERMGRFAGQLITGGIKEIEVTYSGVMTKHKVAPVTMALIYGLLAPIMGETVNAVNALDIAKERAIDIREIQSNREGEFVNLVRVDVVTDKETFSIWGTLSSNHQPRIVRMNKIYVEAIPDGYMLFITNNDRPGIVGAVGTILAQDNINIAGITFGREVPGGLVISVVNIDGEVSEKALGRLRKTKDILSVKVVKV
jgi:D-3-phosphoglycerate dehydrogenase